MLELASLPRQDDDEGSEDEGGQLQGAAELVSEVWALKRARHAAPPDASAMALADSGDGASEWALEGDEDEAASEGGDDDEDDDDLPEAAAHRCPELCLRTDAVSSMPSSNVSAADEQFDQWPRKKCTTASGAAAGANTDYRLRSSCLVCLLLTPADWS